MGVILFIILCLSIGFMVKVKCKHTWVEKEEVHPHLWDPRKVVKVRKRVCLKCKKSEVISETEQKWK